MKKFRLSYWQNHSAAFNLNPKLFKSLQGSYVHLAVVRFRLVTQCGFENGLRVELEARLLISYTVKSVNPKLFESWQGSRVHLAVVHFQLVTE